MQPSEGLQELLDVQESAKEDFSSVTDPAPEKGIFRIVGGYIDDDGNVHNVAHVRAMTGHEEDMLAGVTNTNETDKIHALIAACTEQIGSIRGEREVSEAISRMALASRAHLLICVRIASHWQLQKDRLDVEVSCPHCGHRAVYGFSLLELETYEPDDYKLVWEVETPGVGRHVKWHVLDSHREQVVSALASLDNVSGITAAIAARIVEVDGEDVSLSEKDVRHRGNRVVLSEKAKRVLGIVSDMRSIERDFLTAEFADGEPDINMNITFDCVSCKRDFESVLDISSPSFFFPQATSRRWKRKRFF